MSRARPLWYGLGAITTDPLGYPLPNQPGRDPNVQFQACAAAGFSRDDVIGPVLANWYHEIQVEGGGYGTPGPCTGPGAPQSLIMCAAQRQNLSPAQIACYLQTLASFNRDIPNYIADVSGVPVTTYGDTDVSQNPVLLAAGANLQGAAPVNSGGTQGTATPIAGGPASVGAGASAAPGSTLSTAVSSIPAWAWVAAAGVAAFFFMKK